MKMNQLTISAAAAAVSLCLGLPGVAMASEEDRAKQLCKDKIRDVYGSSNFRHVWGEQVGNHKFKIHGKVRVDDHQYPFNCKVKQGHVKSYAYHGPNPRHRDHDDDDGSLGTALAVGAGLAIVAALAASQSDKGDSGTSRLQVKKSVLEDNCHDMLQYRIRDEHNYTARVHLKNSRIEGHDLVGDAKVKYDGEHPHHASYTCHFDNRGRVMDSRYHLY
jgi:hypothetical protein